jgi:predicted transcriptional regulator
MLHAATVARLLMHENRKSAQASEKPEKRKLDVAPLADLRRKRRSGQLSVVNRLLLSVLLCHADRFGVVSDLGSSALRKATGLSQERLRYRVRVLIDQGLIRAYVPGATSSMLFAKTKSIYVLNLNHSELSGEGSATSVLVCVTGDPFPDRVPDVLHAYRFYSETVLHGGRPKVYGRRPCTPLLGVFEGQSPSFFRLLQMMLEKYAADFLSLHWSDLGVQPFKKWIDAQKWRVLIGKDFRRQKPLSVPDTEQMKEIDDQHVLLLEELCHWAHDLAIWIKDLLCQASDASFGTMDFAIIPQPMALGYYRFALLALPRESDDGRSCLVIEPSAGQQYFGRESEIPLEDRYRYGLLTRPGSEGAAA